VSVSAISEPNTAAIRDKLKARQTPPKKNKAVNLVLICLIVGLLVVGLARSAFQAKPDAAMVTIVAAGQDIPPGVKLGFRNLHYMTVPRTYLTAEMVSTYPALVGRTTNTFIAVGEPILTSSLLPKTDAIADVISVQQRAMTLKLSAENMVDNAVRPGDRVDVIATTTAPNGKKWTKTIAQNILVLFAAPKSMTLSNKINNTEADKMTVSVSPAVAETLAEAVEIGKIRVVLRSAANHAVAVLPGASEKDLLPHEALRVEPPLGHVDDETVAHAAALNPPPPMAPDAMAPVLQAPMQWVVEVFKGAVKESHEFMQK
jgi:pilus assembly protein CpaB